MLKLNSHIVIGTFTFNSLGVAVKNFTFYTFNSVCEVVINSSYETLTDTCTITIPNKVHKNGKIIDLGAERIFKKGQSVVVELGYGTTLTQRFTGFITKTRSTIPFVIECEDMAFKLKEKPFTKTYTNTSLQDILKDMIPTAVTYKTRQVDEKLGKIVVQNATPAQVLEMLRNDYGCFSFFRNGTLYSGLAVWSELQNKTDIVLKTTHNVIDDKGIEYVLAEDIKIKIKAVSILPVVNANQPDKKIEMEAGDSDGEIRTLHFLGITDKNILKKKADEQLPFFKYTGLRGTILTFGEPVIQHGDIVTIKNKRLPLQNGKYIVKSVRTVFGTRGYRQEVALGQTIEMFTKTNLE